jgi:N-acyl-D-amino-acid deacylase
MSTRLFILLLLSISICWSQEPRKLCDIVIRNAEIYDGSGSPPTHGDIAISADTILSVGPSLIVKGQREIDAHGLSVSPGFINMLSHAEESLIADGRSESDVRQGVTLEVFGEFSMGPLTDTLRAEAAAMQSDIKYPVNWTSLGEYLDHLAARGIATNVASFVGAGTVRANVLHYARRAPTSEELEKMKSLVRGAMEEGHSDLHVRFSTSPKCICRRRNSHLLRPSHRNSAEGLPLISGARGSILPMPSVK